MLLENLKVYNCFLIRDKKYLTMNIIAIMIMEETSNIKAIDWIKKVVKLGVGNY